MTTPGRTILAERLRPVSVLVTAVLVLAGLVIGGFLSPAGAAGADSTTTTTPTDRLDASCGFRTNVTGSITRTETVKSGKGRNAGILLFTLKYSLEEKFSDPITGQTLFFVRSKGQVKDTKAKALGGGLFEITTKDTGQQLVVEDGRGRPRGHTSGAMTFNYVINDKGEFVEFLSARFPGPESESMCKVVGSFMGTGSADRLTAYPRGTHPPGTTISPLGYYEYLPPGYGSGAKKPLLLFFHGFGGSGDGTVAQLPFLINDAGIPSYIGSNNWPADRPFVVLAPQHNSIDDPARPYNCPDPFGGSCVMYEQHARGNPTVGSPCTTPSEVEEFLDYAVANYDIDPNRVYVTGLSCGAYGVWEALPRLAGRIAAAVPIAGEGRPIWESSECAVKSAPIWAFHGAADDVVNPLGSSDTIADLETCTEPPDVELKLTVYPGVDHNSWDRAYSPGDGVDIYRWMLDQPSASG